MKKFILIFMFLIVTLQGCSSIPYETKQPEGCKYQPTMGPFSDTWAKDSYGTFVMCNKSYKTTKPQ